MRSNLDSLKEEIQAYLESLDFVVFYGYSRLTEPNPMVHWDTEHYPDYKLFLDIPRQLEVSLVTFHHRELSPDLIDGTLDELEDAELPAGESSRLEKRLGDLRVYEGFTCVVELSFTYQEHLYLYTQRAEWYDELLEISAEIDDYLAIEEEEEDQADSMGGYFSRN